jgi:hypothetical protein
VFDHSQGVTLVLDNGCAIVEKPSTLYTAVG